MKYLIVLALLSFVQMNASYAEEIKLKGKDVFFTGAVGTTYTNSPGTFDFDGKALTFDKTGERKETVFTGNAAAEPPKNKVSPVGWADVTIDGMAYKVPLYQ